MWLYLCSYRLGNAPEFLRQPGRPKAAIVMNALDGYGSERLRNLPREMHDLERLGYVAEELDLRRFFQTPDALIKNLREYHLVWAVGGFAFILARAMNQSGFPKALQAADGIIYAGYWAGAMVAGPDLKGVELIDEADLLPEGYSPDSSTKTLSLVPFRIVPHWKSAHRDAPLADRYHDYLQQAGLDYRCVSDGQALVIDGSNVELVGHP